MAVTYDKIATTTLSSAVTDVTFSSIDGSYTDLILICNTVCSVLDRSIRVQYNGDTATNYSYTNISAYSGGVISQRANNAGHTRIAAVSSTDSPNTYIANFMNYSNTTTYKTHISRGNSAGNNSIVDTFAGLWRSNSAITSIKIFPNTGNFESGGVFTLYGILKA